MDRSRLLVVSACVTIVVACAGRAEVTERCEAAYSVILCDGELFEEGRGAAVDRCRDDVRDARRVGDTCEAALLDLLECLGELDYCEDIWSWRDDRCGAMTEGYCGPQAAAFCAACPGVWYAE
jgi:hypothetical protein